MDGEQYLPDEETTVVFGNWFWLGKIICYPYSSVLQAHSVSFPALVPEWFGLQGQLRGELGSHRPDSSGQWTGGCPGPFMEEWSPCPEEGTLSMVSFHHTLCSAAPGWAQTLRVDR